MQDTGSWMLDERKSEWTDVQYQRAQLIPNPDLHSFARRDHVSCILDQPLLTP
jgi:hypothetical protein